MNNIHSVWKKVSIKGPDECWPWTGTTNSGYVRMDVGGHEGVYAHRIAYISATPYARIGLARAHIDDNVCHTCDNRLCCNPNHLYLGSHKENMQDKVKRNRTPDLRGLKSPNTKFKREDVLAIRSLKSVTTSAVLAREYNVSQSAIKGIWSGRHYKDVI